MNPSGQPDWDSEIGHWLNLPYLYHPGDGTDWTSVTRHYIVASHEIGQHYQYHWINHQWIIGLPPTVECRDLTRLFQLLDPTRPLPYPEDEYQYRLYGITLDPLFVLETSLMHEYQPRHIVRVTQRQPSWEAALRNMAETRQIVPELATMIHLGDKPILPFEPRPPPSTREFATILQDKTLVSALKQVIHQSRPRSSTVSVNDLMQLVWNQARYGDLAVYKALRKKLFPKVTWEEAVQESLTQRHHAMSVFDPKVTLQRGMSRAEEIKKALPPHFQIRHLLDIGCSDGNITDAMASLFRLSRDQVYGMDIVVPQNLPQRKFQFLMTYPDVSPHIPLETGSIDLITCIMSLHHIPDVEGMITEIKRVLSPDGLVVIREHDAGDTKYHPVLNVVHGLYDLVWSQPMENPQHLTEFWAAYQSRDAWRQLFHRHGFRWLKSNLRPAQGVYRAYVDVFSLV